MRGPTAESLALFGVVFLCQQVGAALGLDPVWVALATPVTRPWTLVTGVYAHAGLGHLAVNALALAVVGLPLERYTTRARFHAFVVVTGALAGLAEVLVGRLLGSPTAVLGASGAVLALYGYVLVANPLTGGVLSSLELGRRGRVALVVALALAVTVATAAPGVALVAHFTGFAVGLVAGRYRVLRPS
jgi:membrane associated rhomboid family serine protease